MRNALAPCCVFALRGIGPEPDTTDGLANRGKPQRVLDQSENFRDARCIWPQATFKRRGAWRRAILPVPQRQPGGSLAMLAAVSSAAQCYSKTAASQGSSPVHARARVACVS